ncbi:MAG: 3-methyl-2-oxobutanoate hydroxymethyltransferase [Phycisphaerae bacterium]
MTEPISNPAARVTCTDLLGMCQRGEKIAMLTAYDYPMGRILAQAGIPLILVGDSAAMVVLGHDSTTAVSLDYMVTITAAVRRGAPQAFLMADLPAGSYLTPAQGLISAQRMVQEARADAVKLEVEPGDLPTVAALSAAGISVCAHLGLLPQKVAPGGSYKAQGRSASAKAEIVARARAMRAAGAQMILLEAVPDAVSQAVIAAVDCPVLGCGAGPSCHGHVVVTLDMLGYADRLPRFVEPYGAIPAAILSAVQAYKTAIATGTYPAERHTYRMQEE